VTVWEVPWEVAEE
jgi:hypothetical protein